MLLAAKVIPNQINVRSPVRELTTTTFNPVSFLHDDSSARYLMTCFIMCWGQTLRSMCQVYQCISIASACDQRGYLLDPQLQLGILPGTSSQVGCLLALISHSQTLLSIKCETHCHSVLCWSPVAAAYLLHSCTSCACFADAVSSAAAASAAVEAAEEAEYSVGHKAVTQLPQSRTPARPRATAAETEHPRCC